MIWISLGLTVAILFSSGFYTYYFARLQYSPDIPTYSYLITASIILWILSALLLLTIICYYNAIKLGVAIFKTTNQYVKSNMSVFLVPGVGSLVISLWGVIWLFAAVYIFSVGTVGPLEKYPFVSEVKWDSSTRCVFIYHVLALIWINSLIISCTQFIIGASACIWYFEV